MLDGYVQVESFYGLLSEIVRLNACEALCTYAEGGYDIDSLTIMMLMKCECDRTLLVKQSYRSSYVLFADWMLQKCNASQGG